MHVCSQVTVVVTIITLIEITSFSQGILESVVLQEMLGFGVENFECLHCADISGSLGGIHYRCQGWPTNWVH